MNLNVASLGSIAWEVWQRDQPARVMGVTSRGLFLSIDQRVLFVSFERWRGPLTINLDGSIDQLRALDVGAAAFFSNTRLIFPAIEISLFVSPEVVWQAPLPVSACGPIDRQRDTARRIAQHIRTRAPDRGFAPLLAPLLDLPLSDSQSTERVALLNSLHAVRQAVRDDDLASALSPIEYLLGHGSGLTPSGDDCVLGLLLMLNRWGRGSDRAEFNYRVIELAHQRTTTISANLIECAAIGQADERLLAVVDEIAVGSTASDECVECVLSWGSSSGIDALVGMAVAL